jgi:hypothetical protein
VAKSTNHQSQYHSGAATDTGSHTHYPSSTYLWHRLDAIAIITIDPGQRTERSRKSIHPLHQKKIARTGHDDGGVPTVDPLVPRCVPT